MLVDDESRDGTAEVARRAAERAGRPERLEIVAGDAAPGRLDRQAVGRERRGSRARKAPRRGYLLLTDADIVYAPDALSRLVARAQREGLALELADGGLRCESFAERALIPAFIFFFQMLYPVRLGPIPAQRDRGGGGRLHARAPRGAARGRRDRRHPRRADRRLRARRRAEERRGPIRLSLAERVASSGPIRISAKSGAWSRARPMRNCDIRRCLLALTVAAMVLVFVAPVLAALFGHGGAARTCGWRVGADGDGVPADATGLSTSRRSGARSAGDSARLCALHAGIRPINSCAGAAACGRGACRRGRPVERGTARIDANSSHAPRSLPSPFFTGRGNLRPACQSPPPPLKPPRTCREARSPPRRRPAGSGRRGPSPTPIPGAAHDLQFGREALNPPRAESPRAVVTSL